MNKDISNIDTVILKEKMHRRKKSDAGGRIQVLRVLIRRYYYDRRFNYLESDFIKHCEAVLDNILAKYEYEIEKIIDMWKKIVPALKEYPITCKICEYRPPFCGCST